SRRKNVTMVEGNVIVLSFCDREHRTGEIEADRIKAGVLQKARMMTWTATGVENGRTAWQMFEEGLDRFTGDEVKPDIGELGSDGVVRDFGTASQPLRADGCTFAAVSETIH